MYDKAYSDAYVLADQDVIIDIVDCQINAFGEQGGQLESGELENVQRSVNLEMKLVGYGGELKRPPRITESTAEVRRDGTAE